MRFHCDDLCAFSTSRTVKVRDWRLGVLNYAVLISTVLVLFGYSVAYKCDHLSSTILQTFPEVRGFPPVTPLQNNFGFDIPGMDVQGGEKKLKVPIKITIIDQRRKKNSWNMTKRPTRASFGDIGQFHLGFINHIENNGAHYKTCSESATVFEAFQYAKGNGSTSLSSRLMDGLAASNLTSRDLYSLAEFSLNVRFRSSNRRHWDFFATEPMKCEVSFDVTNRTLPSFFTVMEPRYALHSRKNILIFALEVRIYSDATLVSFSFPGLLEILAGYSFLVSLIHTMVVMFASRVMPEREEYASLICRTSRQFHQDPTGVELTECGDGIKTTMSTPTSDDDTCSSSSAVD